MRKVRGLRFHRKGVNRPQNPGIGRQDASDSREGERITPIFNSQGCLQSLYSGNHWNMQISTNLRKIQEAPMDGLVSMRSKAVSVTSVTILTRMVALVGKW